MNIKIVAFIFFILLIFVKIIYQIKQPNINYFTLKLIIKKLNIILTEKKIHFF